MNQNISKLPKWAQEYIKRLEEDVEFWKEQAGEFEYQMNAAYEDMTGEDL